MPWSCKTFKQSSVRVAERSKASGFGSGGCWFDISWRHIHVHSLFPVPHSSAKPVQMITSMKFMQSNICMVIDIYDINITVAAYVVGKLSVFALSFLYYSWFFSHRFPMSFFIGSCQIWPVFGDNILKNIPGVSLHAPSSWRVRINSLEPTLNIFIFMIL